MIHNSDNLPPDHSHDPNYPEQYAAATGKGDIHIPGAGNFGMAMLLVSLSMLFLASMLALFIIRKQSATWPPPAMPPMPGSLWISTFVILCASITVQRAHSAIRRDNTRRLVTQLIATMIVGIVFLLLQTFNWIEFYITLHRQGWALEGAYLGMFFVLTGLHAAHVIGGLIPLGIVLHRARKGRYSANFHPGVRYVAIYWHFLDIIWVILFCVIYFYEGHMQTAIVTGAGSGIGRAAALLLARRGFAVALLGRKPEPLEETATAIRAAGSQALALPADVSVEAQAKNAVAAAHQKWGRIDALVNCAGSAPRMPLAEMPATVWNDILASNLSSAFYMTQAVWPIMQRQHKPGETSGTIVNISSMASRDPFPGLGAYGAAKLALNMLTTAFAREGEPVGIRIIGIAPGAVDTGMLREVMGGAALPPDILLQPDDIAAIIADAIGGSIRHCSGETLFVHRKPA